MALIDFFSLFICSLLIVQWLNVLFTWGERLALALFLFFLLKGLQMFVLVVIGSTEMTFQMFLSVLSLGGAWALLLARRRRNVDLFIAEDIVPAPLNFKIKWLAGMLLLFGASVGVALWFPITAPDGVWYQVRAWDFLNEGLTAPHTSPQYRQYPPLVPLLFVWLHTCGVPEKILFPLTYLALSFVLYYRIREATGRERMAAWIALAFASTPYVWWHSLMGILNLMAGAFFALGVFYWYALVVRWVTPSAENEIVWPWALLSGIGFGASAWIRPEFILYTGIVLILLMAMLYRFPKEQHPDHSNMLPIFVLPALGLPTVWAGVLIAMIPEVQTSGWGMVAMLLGWWCVSLVWGLGWFRPSLPGLGLCALVGGMGFLTLLFIGPQTSLTPVTAVGMGVYRTLVFQVFFAFTFLFWAIGFTARWSQMKAAQRYLLGFLALYLVFHFAMYTLLPLKSTSAAQFFDSPLISPGDAVNSPDTREYLAWYPIFLLWIAGLPKAKEAFDHA